VNLYSVASLTLSRKAAKTQLAKRNPDKMFVMLKTKPPKRVATSAVNLKYL
jgi:hypothetical protein